MRRAAVCLLATLTAVNFSLAACAPARPGGWIAFTSDRDGNGEIYKMRADGTHVAPLTHNEADELFPSWGP